MDLPPAARAGTGEEFRRYAREALQAVAREVGWTTRPAVGSGDGYDRERRRELDQRLADLGWAGIAVPQAYGGAGRTLAEQAVFAKEAAALGLSTPYNRVALGIVVPALLLFGTEAQKVRLLPAALGSREIWCQGFSETEAGSDLANLRTAARLDGDTWRISGRKVWTTMASEADRCLVLARTEAGSARHRGITALLVPMHQKGVTVRPITQINGDRDFAELELDDAVCASHEVLGALGGGWNVAMTALSYERSLHLLQRQLRLGLMASELQASVKWSDLAEAGERMLDIITSIRGLSRSVESQLGTLERGGLVGVEANASKIVWSETYQALARLGLDLALAGRGGDVQCWTQEYLSSLATSIYAGTNEIQRSIVAERGMGLPR